MNRVAPIVAVVVLLASSGCNPHHPRFAADIAAANGAPSDQPCRTHEDCGDESRYCAKRTGDCDREGACRDRPEICAEVYQPVCGCDGKTYSNACHAAAKGRNVDYDGECEEDSTPDGG